MEITKEGRLLITGSNVKDPFPVFFEAQIRIGDKLVNGFIEGLFHYQNHKDIKEGLKCQKMKK